MKFLKNLFGKRTGSFQEREREFEKTTEPSLEITQAEVLAKRLEKEEKLLRDIDRYVQTHFRFEKKSEGDDVDLTKADSLFEECARVVVQTQSGSTSMLQRRFNLGYNRAGRIMDQLEATGIVGPALGSALRKVLINSEAELIARLNSIPWEGSFPANFYEENKNAIEATKIIYENHYSELKRIEEEERIALEKAMIRNELLEKEKKKQLYNEVYRELLDNGEIFRNSNISNKRELIPQDIMDKVWRRDGGKCVKCGNQEKLEFDHIIPISKGGANSYRNLQILCKQCNIEKSNNIG